MDSFVAGLMATSVRNAESSATGCLEKKFLFFPLAVLKQIQKSEMGPKFKLLLHDSRAAINI
jgi:hypothetical protein